MNNYEKIISEQIKHKKYPIEYLVLGLGKEVGSLNNEIKKFVKYDNRKISNSRKINITNEIGDIVWYLVQIMNKFKIDFNTIIKMNLTKTELRRINEYIANKNIQ